MTKGVILLPLSLLLGTSLARAQSSAPQPRTFETSGYVWSKLSNGQVVPAAGANIYVWPADTTVTRLLGLACLAEASDPSAWMGARTELTDSSGVALEGNAQFDLEILHQLMSMKLAAGQTDSAGYFGVTGLPDGDYWLEAEQMLGSKITQWWKKAPNTSFKVESIGYRVGIDLGSGQSTTNQFCPQSDASIEAAAFDATAFDEGKPLVMPGRVYGGSQVDILPRLMSGTAQPKYPPDLAARGISGTVIARFVVDTIGRVEMSTFRIASSTDIRFSDAIRAAILDMWYEPGMLRGRKVRVMADQPFEFGIKK